MDSTDKGVSFFLRSEAIKGKHKIISKLKINSDKIISNSGETANECTRYYKTLLAKQKIDEAAWAQLAENLPSLTPEERVSCEGAFTYAECWQTITAMADSKSPDCCGLPAEFYKKLFHIFGDIFVDSINNNIGLLSPIVAEQLEAYIPSKR